MRSSERSACAETRSAGATARPPPAASSVIPSDARMPVSSRVASASRCSSVGAMSASAAAAASRKLIASWISNATVTRPPSTPRSYSIGTSRRKRSSWPARRACSAGASGAARNPSSCRSTAPTARSTSARSPPRAVSSSCASAASSCSDAASATLRPVAAGEDAGVPAGERRGLGEADVEAAPGGGARALERRAEPSFIGVEQVGADGARGGGRRELAAGEPGDRERRVGAGAREAGGRPVLPDEQPVPRRGGIAPARVRHRSEQPGVEERGPHSRLRRGKRHVVASCGNAGTCERVDHVLAARPEGPRRAASASSPPGRRARARFPFAEREGSLGRAEVAPRLRPPPPNRAVPVRRPARRRVRGRRRPP